MILLAVDTSGRNGSLALARADREGFKILELIPLTRRMYSAQLIPELQAALLRQGLDKTDLDAFAVASGPGSFTGLRVGLSTVKALSEILHKPIAAVSVLEAAARMTGKTGRVVVALDAGRKQVFVGDYDLGTSKRAIEGRELLVEYEAFFAYVQGSDAKLFSPDASVREAAATQRISINEILAPQADAFAWIGYEKLQFGDTVPADMLEANYIRASDAELFSLPKLSE